VGPTAAAFSPDGRFVALGDFLNQVRLFDVARGTELPGAPFGGHALSFSPDGCRLLAMDMGSVRVWDLKAGKEISSLTLPKTRGPGAAFAATFAGRFTRDGKTLVWMELNTGKFWVKDLSTGQDRVLLEDPQLREFQGETSMALSPDGRLLAAQLGAGGNTVRLWDLDSGKERATLPGHPFVTSMAFSPDGTLLAVGAPSMVKVWEVASGRERATLREHPAWIHSVAFAPDGKTLFVRAVLPGRSCARTVAERPGADCDHGRRLGGGVPAGHGQLPGARLRAARPGPAALYVLPRAAGHRGAGSAG
jgi:WD40 repeat protein